MDGLQFEELLSFKRLPEGWIRGHLLGVDLTICDHRHLQQMNLPTDSLIDIDIDYLISLPADAPWVRPRDVFNALASLTLTPDVVTISRSVNSGFTPLRYRFFADHLAALFEFRTKESDHFDRLFEIDAQAQRGAREAAASSCRHELELHPNCPATHYLLSLTSGDEHERLASRRQAEVLCEGYADSVLREACEFPNRGLPLDLSTVRTLERRSIAGERSPEEDALTSAAIGLLHCHLGRIEAACECYRQATQHFQTHPELANGLGILLIQAHRRSEAIPFLEMALSDNKTAAGAHMLMGSVFAMAKDVAKAQAHLQAASSLAPAWIYLLEMRSVLHDASGQHREAAHLRLRCSQMHHQATKLAEQLETGW